MIKRFKKHILTLPQKIELIILYGVVMFCLGVAAKYLYNPQYPDYYDIEEIGVPLEEMTLAGQEDYDNNYKIPFSQNKLKNVDSQPVIEENNLNLSHLPAHLPARGVDDAVIHPLSQEQLVYEEVAPIAILDEVVVEPAVDESVDEASLVQNYVVGKGGSLTSILVKAGISRNEIFRISQSLKGVYNLRSLVVGQKISLTLKEGANNILKFVALEIPLKDKYVYVVYEDNQKYKAGIEQKTLNKKVLYARGVVKSSLFALSNKLNVPMEIMMEFINHYSFDVDFQRDVKRGNEFAVLYEVYYDDDGKKIKNGDLLYGLFVVNNEPIDIYRYSPSGGESDVDYYTSKGHTLRRSLMKTPINGAVISSPYGKRRHPVLGYTKLHKGVDFAASRGTAFYAGGDGKIVTIGKNGGYGNYIKIKHNAEYSTAYGHIYKFAKGMKKGRRVKQGQVIAYVGSTGRSTGPHLHYEVIKNGKQINPMTVKIPPGKQLEKSELVNFTLLLQDIKTQLKSFGNAL